MGPMMNNRIPGVRGLRELQKEILESEACPRLIQYCRLVAQRKRAMFSNERYWGKAVPSFGDPRAQLVIIGLAPAAHGGNRTGRVFTGDRSGDFLFRALYEAGFANQPKSLDRNDGLKLRNCYITTVVRWAPPQNKPTPMEVRKCLPFLQRELELLQYTKAVLVLGRLAFDVYLRSARQKAPLPPRKQMPFHHGAVYELPSPLPRLFCSYHPSQHNTQTGRLTHSMFRNVLVEIQKYLAFEEVEFMNESTSAARK
jgi:uracil-DNA glycosylase